MERRKTGKRVELGTIEHLYELRNGEGNPMPDWSYRTLFRPLLFRMPAERARSLTLGVFGGLGRLPLGSFVIRTFGHMELSPLLESRIGDARVKLPVGLSGELDPRGGAHRALAQIGFGFVEIGPVTKEGTEPPRPAERIEGEESLFYPDPWANEGVEGVAGRFKSGKLAENVPYMIRLQAGEGLSGEEAAAELAAMAAKLGGFAAALSVDLPDADRTAEEAAERLRLAILALRREMEKLPILLHVPLEYPIGKLEALLKAGGLDGWGGVVVGEGRRKDGGLLFGPEDKEASLDRVRLIRSAEIGERRTIVVKGGIHEPQDALDVLREGADLVMLHAGLVYSGPGLPKRINEAVLYERMKELPPEPAPSFWNSWGWMCGLGAGMIAGGFIAWLIAVSSVLLPYDERFLGLEREAIADFHPLLLHFMSHDRITLAGTMISIGVLYYMLAKHGLRHELHWAKTALLTSGLFGFGSFFLYLGYGYFDPLHGAAAAILLPMFVLAIRGRGHRALIRPPNLRNDRIWQRAQWGQLMFVALGFAFAVGGAVISLVGVTDVFVKEDLRYLGIAPEAIDRFNERLIPLIAHDRAGFGGALFCDAIALLATSLWGIREGDRWIWKMFLFGGMPGFVAALSVHGAIGYTSFIHLLPAYFALALYVAGLILLYPYLMGREAAARETAGQAL